MHSFPLPPPLLSLLQSQKKTNQKQKTTPNTTMPTAVPSPPHTPRSTYHHPARRSHRVGDTLSRRFAKLLCAVFLSLLLAAALLLFFLFLILRPHRPRFHLPSFSLDRDASAASFNVTVRNPNREIGIFYDSFSGSLHYRDKEIASFDRLSMPFYQPPKNTTAVVGSGEVTADEATERQMATDAAVGNGRVGLRLELRSTVRFRVTIWDTHRHRLHVSCGFEVGEDGRLAPEFKDKRCPIYFL